LSNVFTMSKTRSLLRASFGVFLGLSVTLMGVGCAHHEVEEDPSLSPILANDTTLVIEGCGNQPVIGYTYCRKSDGSSALDTLVLHIPPVKCQKNDCVYVKILMPDGSPAVGLSAKEGQSRLEVSWKTLLGRDVFKAGDRGFWIVLVEIHYIDRRGLLKKTLVEGEIRLRVYPNNYLPLNNIKDDPNFVWQWRQNNRLFKMTTNGRVFMGGKGE